MSRTEKRACLIMNISIQLLKRFEKNAFKMNSPAKYENQDGSPDVTILVAVVVLMKCAILVWFMCNESGNNLILIFFLLAL